MHHSIIDYYNKIAASYNELYNKEQIIKFNLIKNKLDVSGLTLDIGSGTGISNNFFNNVINLDPSFNMVKQIKENKICGTAEFLPFKNNMFDNVISVSSLHHFNIDSFIKEVKRVSKKDSKFAFSIIKNSVRFDEVKSKLLNNFKLDIIDNDKDLILISKDL